MEKKTETSFEFIKRRLNEEGYHCKEVIASPYFDDIVVIDGIMYWEHHVFMHLDGLDAYRMNPEEFEKDYDTSFTREDIEEYLYIPEFLYKETEDVLREETCAGELLSYLGVDYDIYEDISLREALGDDLFLAMMDGVEEALIEFFQPSQVNFREVSSFKKYAVNTTFMNIILPAELGVGLAEEEIIDVIRNTITLRYGRANQS